VLEERHDDLAEPAALQVVARDAGVALVHLGDGGEQLLPHGDVAQLGLGRVVGVGRVRRRRDPLADDGQHVHVDERARHLEVAEHGERLGQELQLGGRHLARLRVLHPLR
jgi:hypothetical protein